MSPQPHVPHAGADGAQRSAATRASSRTDHSWSDDSRAPGRVPSAPDTSVPTSPTAISQADGEA